MLFCFQHFDNLASQPWLFPINQAIGGCRRSWGRGGGWRRGGRWWLWFKWGSKCPFLLPLKTFYTLLYTDLFNIAQCFSLFSAILKSRVPALTSGHLLLEAATSSFLRNCPGRMQRRPAPAPWRLAGWSRRLIQKSKMMQFTQKLWIKTFQLRG